MTFYEKNQHDKRHNVHKGMIMEGICEMKPCQSKGCTRHAATRTGDASQKMHGAADAGKVEKRVQQNNREDGFDRGQDFLFLRLNLIPCSLKHFALSIPVSGIYFPEGD
jgi:hypothetical protein